MSDGEKAMIDYVNHPPHYQSKSGIECIDVIEDMPYNIASAIKYLWRCGKKWDAKEDLEKAEWFIRRELQRVAKNKNDDYTRSTCCSTETPGISEGEAWCRLFAKQASDP